LALAAGSDIAEGRFDTTKTQSGSRAGSPLTVNLILGFCQRLSIKSGLLAETVPSTFAKVLNMQAKGSNTLNL
jgi:hypothetical protein